MRTDRLISHFVCDGCGATATVDQDDEEQAGIMPRGWYRLYDHSCNNGWDHCGAKCLTEFVTKLAQVTT